MVWTMGSPQHRKVHFAEAGLFAQFPVSVVAHPRVVLGLPVHTKHTKLIYLQK